MSATLSKVQGELKNLGTSATQAGSAASSAGPHWVSMSTAVAAGSVAANAFMAVARGVTGVLSSAGSASADFGQSMANIRSLIPDAEFAQFGAQLQQTALRLGKDYPLSASEAGHAMELLAQKGISAETIINGGADAVVRLSSATGSDLATAAHIAANALDTFHVPAEKMNDVTNLMTGAMTKGGLTAAQFGEAMQAGGAAIALTGGTVQDASIAIAAMAKAGIEGSDAGTSLKTMYGALQPSTKAATTAMLELGLVTKDGGNAFFDSHGKVKSYEEISRILSTSLEGLTDQQKAMTLRTIFGSDALRAAAISADLGAGKFGDLGDQIRSVNADDVATKRMDSLKGSMLQFGGSAETIGIVLLSKLGPAMKTVVDTGTMLLNDVLEALDSADASTFFAGLSQAVSDTADSMLAFTASSDGWMEQLRGLGPIGAAAAAALAPLMDAIVGLALLMKGDAKGAAGAFEVAFSELSDTASTLAGAFGPVTTALGQFATFIGQVAQKATDMGAVVTLKYLVLDIGTASASAWQDLDKVAASIARMGGAAGDTNARVSTFAGLLQTVATGLDLVVLNAGAVISTYATVARVIADTITVFLAMEKATLGIITGNKDLKESAARDIAGAFLDTIDAVNDWRAKAVPTVQAGMADIKNLMGSGAAAAAAEHERGLQRAATVTQDQMQFIEANVSDGMTGVVAAAGAGATEAAAQVAAAGPAFDAAGAANIAAVSDAITSGTPAVTAAADAAATGAVAAVQAQVPAASAAADAMGATLPAGIDAAAPAMAASADSAASGAVAAVAAQQGAASAAGEGVGSNLGSGMESGILSWVGRIAAAARSLVANAISAGQAEGEIHSPSEKTKRDGKNLGQGYIDGLVSVAPEMAQRIRDFVGASTDYLPVAGQIAGVEREIKDIRERSQTDALFRGQQMITIDSESLRLKRDQVSAERDLIPLRQQLARATQDVNDLERGSLPDRTQLIELDGKRKELRLQEIDLETQLVGLDRNSKKAETIQKQIDKLTDQDRLLGLEADRITTTNGLAAIAARVRKEGLDTQVTAQQRVIDAIKSEIETLGGEQALFSANEAIIKNATDNEVNYRNRLIAVFTAEGKPLTDRIAAGLKLVEQLHNEGKISDELYESLKKLAEKAGVSTTNTASLGGAAEVATPQIDAAAKKAKEMADQAARIADEAHDASHNIDALSSSLGRIPDWAHWNTGSGGQHSDSVGSSGTILSGAVTAAYLSGDSFRAASVSGPSSQSGLSGSSPGGIRIYIGDREMRDWYVETTESLQREGRLG